MAVKTFKETFADKSTESTFGNAVFNKEQNKKNTSTEKVLKSYCYRPKKI